MPCAPIDVVCAVVIAWKIKSEDYQKPQVESHAHFTNFMNLVEFTNF